MKMRSSSSALPFCRRALPRSPRTRRTTRAMWTPRFPPAPPIIIASMRRTSQGLSPFSNTNSATTTPPPDFAGVARRRRRECLGCRWRVQLVGWREPRRVQRRRAGAVRSIRVEQCSRQLERFICSPNSVTVTATKNYTFTGNGNLAGSMALTKTNSGTLTVNTTNTFHRRRQPDTRAHVSLGNSAAAGTGAIRFNGGTLTLSGSDQPSYANRAHHQFQQHDSLAGRQQQHRQRHVELDQLLPRSTSTSPAGTFTIGGNITGYPGHGGARQQRGFLPLPRIERQCKHQL
jgi:hypothetical protein